MSTLRNITEEVVCDKCSRKDYVSGMDNVPLVRRLKAMRYVLNGRGWSHAGKKDFCATCTQEKNGISCHAQKDGECGWPFCPQHRDQEPKTTGRHCPLAIVH